MHTELTVVLEVTSCELTGPREHWPEKYLHICMRLGDRRAKRQGKDMSLLMPEYLTRCECFNLVFICGVILIPFDVGYK